MTIYGIPGVTIQNHTGHRNSYFKELFEEFDWEEPERIRSVHEYDQNPNEVGWLRDSHPYILPRPVYFHDGQQDDQNRWPSHPGYMNPNWTPNDPVGDGVVEDQSEAGPDEDEPENNGQAQNAPTVPYLFASQPTWEERQAITRDIMTGHLFPVSSQADLELFWRLYRR
jgi:hypothetical protein